MKFVGIDLGTSFVKGAVLDLDQLSIGPALRVASPPPRPGLPPLRTEHAVEGFVTITRQLIDGLVAEAPECAGLVLTGQMGGLVLLDARGRALTPYISWQDRRLLEPDPSGLGSCYDALLSRLTSEDWVDLGHEVRPGTPLSFLHWLKETGALPPRADSAATLADFVLGELCGVPPAMHSTCGIGAFNVRTCDWHHALFERLGLGGMRWPALRELHEPIGECPAGPRRLRCYPPVGDHPCALAGTLLEFDELSLNIATGSQVALRSRAASPGDYQTLPFFDGEFLHRISHLPAGRALNALVRLLSELALAQQLPLADPWLYIIRAAETAPASDVKANLAFFPAAAGEDAGRSFSHLRGENLTVGQLFRAALSSMAETYHASALRLSPAQAWRRLVFSGGLAQNLALLRRLVTDRFQRPCRLSATPEDTLQGLLVLALAASGRARSVQDAMEQVRRGSSAVR